MSPKLFESFLLTLLDLVVPIGDWSLIIFLQMPNSLCENYTMRYKCSGNSERQGSDQALLTSPTS